MSSLDEIILSSYGGLEQNSLSNLIDDNDEVTERSTLINMTKHSPYFDLEHFNTFIRDKKNKFTIPSTNIESIHSKINDLTIFVEQLREINFEFSAICLQEC